jgi:hypothetical protein
MGATFMRHYHEGHRSPAMHPIGSNRAYINVLGYKTVGAETLPPLERIQRAAAPATGMGKSPGPALR